MLVRRIAPLLTALALLGCASSAERMSDQEDRAALTALMGQVPPAEQPRNIANVEWGECDDHLGRLNPAKSPLLAVHARLGVQTDSVTGSKAWVCGVWAFDLEDRFVRHELIPIRALEAGDAASGLAVDTCANERFLLVKHDTVVIRQIEWDGARFCASELK
ncbi:MAG TPA: hypothetical protein DEA08_21400 [Planctomycetes bacterium]|nr:hypothetical protein [Planctomycetota bacterium]